MKKARINDLWFYKYRYQIGYCGLFISYIVIILYTILVAPRGLTASEINSAYESSQFSFANLFSADIVNAPYKLFQGLSISLFGLSTFSIKLPSLIISALALFGIIKLTNKWFSPGIATLASVIAIASSQFFFLAQNGSPEILYILYPVLILYFGATFISAKNKIPSIIAFSTLLGLSLYTPLGVYILLAMILTIFAHPHLRFLIKKTAKKQSALVFIILPLLIAPLLIAIFRDFNIAKELIGIPDSLNIFDNAKDLFSHLFSFSSPSDNGILSPIINSTSLILIGVGLFFTLSSRYTSRSYLINIWSLILFSVCLINPNSATILFTPILILTVSGLQSLVHTWYTLFPKNPYARVTGLLPVVVLVVSLLFTSFENFRLNYTYSPTILTNFSQDLEILKSGLSETQTVLVSETESKFYKILENNSDIKIVDEFKDGKILISNAAYSDSKIPKNYKIKHIYISSKKDQADRFYLLERS